MVDRNGIIIVGHGRYLAFKRYPEGIAEPRIEVAEDLTEEQVIAYRLADNKLNESPWDMNFVVEDLKILTPPMIDITGFSRDLISENNDRDDYIPVDVPAKAKLGEIYKLGRHKIMCGSATNDADVEKLMGGVLADMVFTDPPYNINYKGSGENTSNTIENDNMDESAFLLFLCQSFISYRKTTKDGAGLYIFHSDKTQDAFMSALDTAGFRVKNQLIWNKPSAGMGMGEYRRKHEPFFYCTVKDQNANFYGDRTNNTIWDFEPTEEQLAMWASKVKRLEREGKTTIWSMQREATQDYVHPTQKPVELILRAIHNSSKAGDIITDFFLGSFSTLIACEKSNRTCIGLELDPRYVDIGCQRFLDFTGIEPIRESDGKKWSEIKLQ